MLLIYLNQLFQSLIQVILLDLEILELFLVIRVVLIQVWNLVNIVKLLQLLEKFYKHLLAQMFHRQESVINLLLFYFGELLQYLYQEYVLSGKL